MSEYENEVRDRWGETYAYKGSALLYISDQHFKEYYDGRVRGLAQYVHNAIMAQEN
mgnify:FL=1